ncbi:MAG: FAD-dependent oxidoreductase [Clostridia bacterium]|nr:FAD-dependent oxidoreductase [Clostridia bacterium]
MYDIIIVGAGPAGLTAAIYARRAEKSVLLIEKECFGGQITKSPRVENYPGSRSLSGAELGDLLFEHATDLGAEIELDTVVGLGGKRGNITVKCEGGEYTAKAVIIATGSTHRRLGLYNEEKFIGEGISFCAVCDGAFYKDKKVIVVGGGNSALQEAILLSETAREVVIVQNLGEVTGEKSLKTVLDARDNVKFILGAQVYGILEEDGKFAGIIYQDIDGKFMLGADGMFVAIGQVPQCEAFADVVTLNRWGYAEAGESCVPESKIEGVFVAGDCRTKSVRQVTTATADGTVAALAACKFVDDLNLRRI